MNAYEGLHIEEYVNFIIVTMLVCLLTLARRRVEVEREIKNGESGLREIRDLLSEVDSKDRELKRSMQDRLE